MSELWAGTRWLSRWDKEIGLFVKLLYYGLTIGQGTHHLYSECTAQSVIVPPKATQTLGEEYTGIWMHSVQTNQQPSRQLRVALILLPTLPSYIAAKWGSALPQDSKFTSLLRRVPPFLEILAEINLAVFYLRGTFYHLTRRILGTRYVSGHVRYPLVLLSSPYRFPLSP